jgi:hypothetical protein
MTSSPHWGMHLILTGAIKGAFRPHLLVTETEGFLAPVPIQLQNTNQVPNRSDNRQAKNRLDPSPRFQSSTSWKSLILKVKGRGIRYIKETELSCNSSHFFQKLA